MGHKKKFQIKINKHKKLKTLSCKVIKWIRTLWIQIKLINKKKKNQTIHNLMYIWFNNIILQIIFEIFSFFFKFINKLKNSSSFNNNNLNKLRCL